MSNYFNNETWEQLTKSAVPIFVIKNKPLFWNGVTLQPDEVFPGLMHEARKMYRLHRIGVAPQKPEQPKEVKSKKWVTKKSHVQ